MLVFILILLLMAAAFGVLGAVIKAAVVLVFSVILAAVLLIWGTIYYVRFRLRRFVREAERHHGRYHRGYDARGYKEPEKPELPPD